jgi:hypothetical protein
MGEEPVGKALESKHCCTMELNTWDRILTSVFIVLDIMVVMIRMCRGYWDLSEASIMGWRLQASATETAF